MQGAFCKKLVYVDSVHTDILLDPACTQTKSIKPVIFLANLTTTI